VTVETSRAGMKSDHRPKDIKHRLKTPAGLQLISRSKRKEMEEKRPVSSSGSTEEVSRQPQKKSFENMRYTVKNEQASVKQVSPTARVAATGEFLIFSAVNLCSSSVNHEWRFQIDQKNNNLVI